MITNQELRDYWKKVADAVDDNKMQTSLPPDAARATKQDTMIASLGNPTDVEATGNGSIIGVLKRLRTLIGDTIVTIGSAIGNKAQLIAGSDGTNARALKTAADGTLLTQLTGRNVELTYLANAVAITDNNERTYQIPAGLLEKYKEWDVVFYNTLMDASSQPVRIQVSIARLIGSSLRVYRKDGTPLDYIAAVVATGHVQHIVSRGHRQHLSAIPIYHNGVVEQNLIDPLFWQKYRYATESGNERLFVNIKPAAVPANGSLTIVLQGVLN